MGSVIGEPSSICELHGVVPRTAFGDDPAILHHEARPVEAERAEQPAAAAEQRHELALLERPVCHMNVGIGRDHADRQRGK